MLRDEDDFNALRLLDGNPRVSQRDLASAMGISLGKANYCLNALMEKGLIKMQNFRSSENKLAYAYLLTPAGIAAKASLTASFLKLKVLEYEKLKNEIEGLRKELVQGGQTVPQDEGACCKK